MNKNRKTILILTLFFVILTGITNAETITNLEITKDSDLIEIKAGDTFILQEGESFVVDSGKSLVIESGASLIIESGATMEFSADSLINISGTLTNHGKITNHGIVNNYGTIINYELQNRHYEIKHRPGIINNYGLITNYGNIKNYSIINGDINNAPDAIIEGPDELIVNTTITFSGTKSTDIDGEKLVYQWDFGDGNNITSDDEVYTHRYNTTGIYTVKLTVKDNLNAFDSDTLRLIVVDEQDGYLKAIFTLAQDEDVVDTSIGTVAKLNSTLNKSYIIIPVGAMLFLSFLKKRD